MLKRKYGNTIEAIMAFREKASAELDALQNGQARRAKTGIGAAEFED